MKSMRILAAAIVASAGLQDTVTGGSVRPLQPDRLAAVLFDGASIDQEAASGDTHRYEVVLAAGDFFEISVSQNQVRVTIAVRGPNDALLRTVNFQVDPLPERLLFVPSIAGRYLIEVSVDAGEPSMLGVEREPEMTVSDAARSYSLRVLALRPATSDDLARARWFDALEQAVKESERRSLDGVRQAIRLYAEAAKGWQSVGDAALEATTLEALASLASFFAQFARDSALALERLTNLYGQLGDRHKEFGSWRQLAIEYGKNGRLADAKAAVSRAIALARSLGLRVNAARSLRELGYYEFELGNFTRAGELARQAHDLAAALPDPTVQALTLYDLARLDTLAGDLDAAVTRQTEALSLASGQTSATAVITMWLGFSHLARGELEEAASRFDARLAIASRFVQRDQEALTRLGLADVKRARGDRDQAREGYEAAAAALERGVQQYRCIAEQRLARMDLEDGRLDDAHARVERMIEIAARRSLSQCEAEARAVLADLAARRGDLDTEDAEARRVIELTETFREAAASLESRTLGFGSLAPAYERAIDVSMRRAQRGDTGAIARAFTLNEQAMARGLLDRLLETRLDAHARVPTALAAEHAATRETWRARLAELEVSMRARPDAPETATLVTETGRLAVRMRDLEAKVDAADARQASFVRPRPLAVPDVQQLLDDDTVLLEYALGDARSYLWVVSPGEITAFTLSSRTEIETVARRVHQALSRSPVAVAGTGPRSEADDRRALTRLIIEPAASLLAGKRLVVVLPGALSLIPFGALPQPIPGPEPPPMIAAHEVVQVPSATILAATRSLARGRPRPTKTAAIFADPVFDTRDPRLRHALRQGPPVSAPSPVRRAGVSLGRLPFSRGEADAIRSLAPTDVTTFVGLDATRDRVIDRALFDYRFIHFATHGIVHQEVPSLSSLVLSLVDSAGRSRDGLVMMPDIYDMTLNADLVVLSGCQTALGKPVRGEGPIGLARAFMYAGVPRVVASLWLVDDLATAELMKRFYRGILVDRLAPAAALRSAQREMAAIPRWQSPYFWAPFVLQGDWR